MSKLLTLDDVEQILQIKKRTLKEWIRNGKLQAISFSNKTYRIDEDTLKEFIENQKKK